MEKILELESEYEAVLQPHQCPVCGYVNGLNAEYSDVTRIQESGVMEGKPYQIVEIVTTVCRQCGTAYNIKNYI